MTPAMRRLAHHTFVTIALVAPPAFAEGPPPMHHAHGLFSVTMRDEPGAGIPGTARRSIDKVLHGDLEGNSRGDMISAGDPASGAAGYVAIETVTGTLAGRHGSFSLLHLATMDASGHHMTVVVAPGSGTDGLRGLAGTFTITIEGGRHGYDLAYSLPD